MEQLADAATKPGAPVPPQQGEEEEEGDTRSRRRDDELDKKARGRLKKLTKRCRAADPSREVSGLVEPGEWSELRELLVLQSRRRPEEEDGARSTPDPAPPALQWRRGKRGGGEAPSSSPVADASDHRDLLFRLLSAGGSRPPRAPLPSPGRKRRLPAPGEDDDPAAGTSGDREEEEAEEENGEGDEGAPEPPLRYRPRVPPWASIHNPARIERAAVLELHCSTQSQYESVSNGLLALVDEGGDGKNGGGGDDGGRDGRRRGGLAVPTRWFANPQHPKAMSHGILYATPAPDRRSRNPPRGGPKVATARDLHRALAALAPTPNEMREEGYPVDGAAPPSPCHQPTAPAIQEPEASASPRAAAGADGPAAPADRAIDADADPGAHLLPFPGEAAAQETVRRSGICASVGERQQRDGHGSNAVARDYVRSADKAELDGPDPRILAVDCEMVETTVGRELARVTVVELVDFDGESEQAKTVLRMDHLVRPQGVVTDYLTQFSGITAPLLEAGPTVTLAQVQAALCEFVSPRDVLVGHSLENDLHALRLVHPTVVDTALIFRARGAKHKHSLRHLALNLLRRQIQPRGGPHCSLEDATAALDLAVRRAVKGPSYARHLVRPQPVNLLTSTFRHHPQHPADTAVCLGPAEWLREHVESRSNVHALTCDSPSHPNRRAAASWLTASSPSRRARLAYVSWRLGGGGGGGEESPTGAGGGGTAAAAVAVASDAGDALSFVRDLRSRVDAATVLCVALQVGFHETSRLAELRKARLNPKATAAWTDQEEERWTRMCNASRDGRVFWILGGQ